MPRPSALAKVKNNADSGVFGAVQEAAIELNGTPARDQKTTESYRRRRDILVGVAWRLSKRPYVKDVLWAGLAMVAPHASSRRT